MITATATNISKKIEGKYKLLLLMVGENSVIALASKEDVSEYKCMEGGSVALKLKKGSIYYPLNNQYSVLEENYFGTVDVNGDYVSGGGYIVNLFVNGQCPKHCTEYSEEMNVSFLCDGLVMEWLQAYPDEWVNNKTEWE